MKFKLTLVTILAVLLAGCQNASEISVQQDKSIPIDVSVDKQDEIVEELGDSIPKDLVEDIVVPLEKEEEIVEVKVPVEVSKEEPLDFFNLDVDFVPQAPYQVWDELHEEACEEAAIITVAKYFNNEKVTPHVAEQAILSLVGWEEENNYKIDLTANEAAEILKEYFGLFAELKTDITTESIKQELRAGRLIIIPAAGRQLGNPNFKTPGPIYHMLVIRGYDDKTGEFITNDPGTRKGEGYRYKYQKLIDAIHDWDHELAENEMTDQEMESGRKVIIVIQE